MRLFIGVALPVACRKQVDKLLVKLKRKHWPVAWEQGEKLHFTLAFLGEIEPARLPKVQAIAESSCQGIAPFTLQIKGLGCFPDYFQPRIIWLGLKGELQPLARLQNQLKAELRQAEFKIDERPFRPHITLGRIRQARFRERKEIGRQLKGLRIQEIPEVWFVEQVQVFASKTLPTGSVYEVVAEVPL